MTTLLILSGFYIIWLAALLTVAYTPRLFHNYTLFKAINSASGRYHPPDR